MGMALVLMPGIWWHASKPELPRENDGYWEEEAEALMVWSRGAWWQFTTAPVDPGHGILMKIEDGKIVVEDFSQ